MNCRSIWEKAHGKEIPKGYQIHHKDFNPENNNPENLVCIRREEHKRIHGHDTGLGKGEGDKRKIINMPYELFTELLEENKITEEDLKEHRFIIDKPVGKGWIDEEEYEDLPEEMKNAMYYG